MNFKIFWDEKALSELEKLDIFVARRIAKKVRELESDPLSQDVARLRGSQEFRLRVGDYRVIFSLSHQAIEITKVGHRRNIYKP